MPKSVVIDDVYLEGISSTPTKNDSPLVVDPDRIKTLPAALEPFESIPRRNGQNDKNVKLTRRPIRDSPARFELAGSSNTFPCKMNQRGQHHVAAGWPDTRALPHRREDRCRWDGRGLPRPRRAARPRCGDQGAARGVAQDPERLARFEREAKLLASLSHQNIATLYGLESTKE